MSLEYKMQPQIHTKRRRGTTLMAPSFITMITAIILLSIQMESSESSAISEGLNGKPHQQAHVTSTTSDMRQISKRHTSEKDFAPKLIHQPQSVLVQPNKPHTIECPVEAKPEAEVKWFKDRQLLVSQPAHLEQTGSELMFFQMSDDDTGDYYCQATNYLGSIESENFRLTVQSSIHDPRIGLEPRLTEVGAEQQVEFTCSIPSTTTSSANSRQKSQQRGASQQQSPEVGWRRNGKRLEVKWLDDGEELQEARSRFVARRAGPSEFVLTITRTQLKDDNATFTCLFTPDQAQDGSGFEPEAADLSSSADSSSEGHLAHESSPAKLRVYALDHRQQQQQPANAATPDGHVKLDVNLAPPIDNLVSNRPHEILQQQQPAASANHTTQLSHQHSRSRSNTTLKQTLEDLYEISKPMLVICGIVLLVIVGPALLYISRRTCNQNRYMKHHQFNGCGGSAGSSGPGSGASSAIGALGTIECHDPVLNSLMARTLSAPNGASLAGGGPAAVAAALNGKKYRSYRDHMRKVAAANEAAAAVGCNDLVDGYFAAAVAAAAAAQQQQQQHPTTVGDHNSAAAAAAAAANSFFAAANSAAALPNLYNQSLAAREQARSLLQASEHMRSLSNLSHVAAHQKHQQHYSRLGQNGSHLNLPLSFAFGNPITTSNGSNSNNSQTTGRGNGEQANSAAPGAARLIDGAAQLMASALWPPQLAHFASGRGVNHHHQQQQATAGLLSSCQPSRTLQSDEHYQLVNCSSVSPSSSSSIVGSNSSSNPRDSHLRPQGVRDSTSLNHYSTIGNNEDDEDRYEEVDHNQTTCDSTNNSSSNRHLQTQRTLDAADAQRQESLRISRISTFGSNNGGGNSATDHQQRQLDSTQNQKQSSLRSSFISSSNSSSSGCGDSTNTSSSLASDAFSRFGLKQRSHRQNQTRSGRQQDPNDQLSPYAVSSICGSIPKPQVPPPPMSSEAMRALNEQFDINQLMLLDESATMTDNNNQDGLIGFNAPPPPPPTEISTVDSNNKVTKEATKEDNLRSQLNRRKFKNDQQE